MSMKLTKYVPKLLVVLIISWVLYNYAWGIVGGVTGVVGGVAGGVTKVVGGVVGSVGDAVGFTQHDESNEYEGNVIDMGMYDVQNPDAFGTTEEAERRITNDGVRKEFHNNAFPWAECTCDTGACDKHGIPNPTEGHTHVCKNGFPSKRIVDMYGGHFQLNHICAPGTGECAGEPAVLGRWWCKNGCSNPESVGLDVRPLCSRCK